jgi:hypothetical protein
LLAAFLSLLSVFVPEAKEPSDFSIIYKDHQKEIVKKSTKKQNQK